MKATRRPAGHGWVCVLCESLGLLPPSLGPSRTESCPSPPRGRGASELWPIGASPSGTIARDAWIREAAASTAFCVNHKIARVGRCSYENQCRVVMMVGRAIEIKIKLLIPIPVSHCRLFNQSGFGIGGCKHGCFRYTCKQRQAQAESE